MKKIFTLAMIMFGVASINHLQAQGIYQFFGNTINGATDDKGTIYSLKYDGTGHNILKQFEIAKPGTPGRGERPVEVNGKLYTVFSGRFTADEGAITEYTPANNNYVRKADLKTIGGVCGAGSPTLYNGKLYGLSSLGGDYKVGLIYRYDPVTNELIKLHDFDTTNGAYPFSGMTLFNGKLYGMTNDGGANDAGVIFELDPANNTVATKINFVANLHGRDTETSFVEYNNLLWGITGRGGVGGNGGGLFSYNPATNAFVFKKNLSSIGFNSAWGTPVIMNNKMYGFSQNDSYGGFYEYDFAGNTLSAEFTCNAETISADCGLLVYNNKLYGAALGGNTGAGMIFHYDPASNVYTPRINLDETTGKRPTGALTLYNNRMYIWNAEGGIEDDGTLIDYNPVNNTWFKRVDLGNDGRLWHPVATPVYHNGKVYGLMTGGGQAGRGGIYEYDVATGVYLDKYIFGSGDGNNIEGGGLVMVNNKIYGTSLDGGSDNAGSLFEYDPATGTYSIKHHFINPTGQAPYSKIMTYNGKIYGTTDYGGTNGSGVIYEFDPATGVYVVKVHLGGAFGTGSRGGLTAYNNRLYGTTMRGGNNNAGTLFEFNPAINSFAVRVHFNPATTGVNPSSAMAVYNGLLYGVTEILEQNQQFEGSLYEFNPVTYALTKKHTFAPATGYGARSTPVVMYKKIYGIATRGGNNNAGVIYAYDPATGIYSTPYHYSTSTGVYAGRGELAKVPAKTAPGNPGSCVNAGSININATNNNEWVPLADESGEAILEINAGGNNLGNVSVNYYVHNGAVRKDDGGRPYLDRNFRIDVQNTPTSQVNVRFYIRRNEFDALKNTPGSNINTSGDLGVFTNNDGCGNAVVGTATPLTPFNSAWREDYVVNVQLTGSASFYFGYRNFTVLPVNILSFTGNKEGSGNKLTWKASCTNAAEFVLERSADGNAFTPVATINATAADCNQPFYYTDANVGNGKYYYRLKITELNAAAKYSSIVFLNRDAAMATGMNIVPNPVAGATANLQVNAAKAQTLQLIITDATGRIVLQKKHQRGGG